MGTIKTAVGDETEMLQMLSQLDQPVFVITLDEKFFLVKSWLNLQSIRESTLSYYGVSSLP